MARPVKVAECAAMYFHRGRLIWDDYLHHRQFELTPDAQVLCRTFAEFADPDEVLGELDVSEAEAVRTLITELIEGGVLIEEGSAAHEAERRLLAAWADWGHSAWQYHFASRTLADASYASHDVQEAELDAKLAVRPAPAPFRRNGHGPHVVLPVVHLSRAETTGREPAADQAEPVSAAAGSDSGSSAWSQRALLDVLLTRRTTRDFLPGAIQLADLATLLRVVAGPSPIRPQPGRSATVFKLTPSAGGRHPVELYLHAGRVTGLAPGWYHYDAAEHRLEPVSGPWTPRQLSVAAGDQDWIGSAAVTICYIAVLERVRWKYDTARTYRMLQMDVGHLSQTAYLVATAMGLGVGFSAALRDELIERELGCDPNQEIVLGLTALGHAA